ncbi:sigma-54-dependent transcriptional regulator [Desulfatitalea alkaliphila]|uniref:Sigma 54-interacting transcriptional regulator n=1 Tax=Desulfatitalea alkaliphila TaxID=2929485 RepID=A0AA41R601_9BACT|nr:sigma 54-interacting transcriptional regulator [Desulfatitalea alkaliphila]MCJ8502128.1 sigma 54-interacting transcriptional regulator [Desulfatitalea alkaliphila]
MATASLQKPVIVFAKSAAERGHWRSVLLRERLRVFCFERETNCFDNLASIDPAAVVLRTDSTPLVWRFGCALHACRSGARLLVLSKTMMENPVQTSNPPFPVQYLASGLAEQLDCEALKTTLRAPLPAAPLQEELLVGDTPEIRGIRTALAGVTKNCDPILITGESGTGKEHLARMIAQRIDGEGAFIRLDCAQLNGASADHDRMAAAHAAGDGWWPASVVQAGTRPEGATVLLHNVHCLDAAAQSKILLLLEDNWWASRVLFIATAGVGLADLVERRRFRRDLFYRLNVIPFYLPPLRNRKPDLPLLMDHFVIAACARRNRSFMLPSADLVQRLYGYPWPGNLDELCDTMQRLVDLGSETSLFAESDQPWAQPTIRDTMAAAFEMEADLDPSEIQKCMAALGRVPLKSICDHYVQRTEKKLMQQALAVTSWNRKRAAALLNISYKSMLNKMRNYEIV